MSIRKNDTVLVIAGKDKGKRGTITRVIPREDRVVVEGVNVVKRHTRGQAGARQAGIIQQEAPLAVSNVVLVCNKCNAPTKVKSAILEDGRKVRVCRKCNETVD
jgi:large subunit ribosomal protein L24